MTASITVDGRPPLAPAMGGSRAAGQLVPGGSGRRVVRRLVGLLDDVVFLLLAVLLIPAAVLLVGIPVALVVGVLLEMAQGEFSGLLYTIAPLIVAAIAALWLARRLSRR